MKNLKTANLLIRHFFAVCLLDQFGFISFNILHGFLKKKLQIIILTWVLNIDAHRGGGPHVPPIKILKNFHMEMQ